MPVPNLHYTSEACILYIAVWDPLGVATSLKIIPSTLQFCESGWHIPKFFHDTDQAKAGVGIWTLRLGSALMYKTYMYKMYKITSVSVR